MLILKPVGGPRPRHESLGCHFLNKPLDQAHVLLVYMAQRRGALRVDTTGEREMRGRCCPCVQVSKEEYDGIKQGCKIQKVNYPEHVPPAPPLGHL